MLKKTNFAATASAIGLGLGVLATAAFAADGDAQVEPAPAAQPPAKHAPEPAEIALIERTGDDLKQAINAHRTDELSGRYRELYSQAEELGVEPKESVLAGNGEPQLRELTDEVPALREDVEKAREESQVEDSDAAGGLVGGVSQSTLDAIAACESGGDPTAVNAGGYYGKYQFDTGTWASVGGTGNPAEASEAEQDMRASMLYAQAGSTPWPVCGQ